MFVYVINLCWNQNILFHLLTYVLHSANVCVTFLQQLNRASLPRLKYTIILFTFNTNVNTKKYSKICFKHFRNLPNSLTSLKALFPIKTVHRPTFEDIQVMTEDRSRLLLLRIGTKANYAVIDFTVFCYNVNPLQ